MNECPEYTVYFPTGLTLDDTEYMTAPVGVISLEPVPDEERRKGCKWPLWRLKCRVGAFVFHDLYLDRPSRISAPGGTTYEYRDFPGLAAKMANDELERILGGL